MPELRHPKLPGRSIHVHDDAVPVHEAAGWRRVDDSPAEPVNREQEDDLLDLEEGD